jgi:hypothetical protein
VAVALAALALYSALLCPVPAGKDGSEFTLVLATLGVAHPTGYPLYTLIGHVFVKLLHAAGMAWGTAANAFSALGGACALGLLHALATRLVRPHAGARTAPWLALLPVAALAWNPVWTTETTLAEVNSWQVAWAVGAALAALTAAGWLETPATRDRAALLWGLVSGAGLAHHASGVLLSAPLSLALIVAARGGRVRFVLRTAAAALVPLASLGLVVWRAYHPAGAVWPALEGTFTSIAGHLGGALYRGYAGHFAPSPFQRHLLGAYVYPWLALALAAGVLPVLLGRGATILRVLAGAVLLQAAACFAYGVPDPAPYFLAPLALALALLLARAAAANVLRPARFVLLPLTAAALLGWAWHGTAIATERRDTLERFDARVRDMWSRIPAGPAFVVWDDDMAARLLIFQRLDGERPELTVVQPRWLSYPAERRRFVAAHGFDPVDAGDAGSSTDADAAVERVIERLRREAGQPVLLFLPQVPSLRLLPRPGPADADRP